MRDCKVNRLYRNVSGGDFVAKNLDVVLLVDYYGEMLTDNQRKFLDYYYNDDLSLSEIAENEGISRQGVRDAIKRAEAQLFDMEKKLGFAKRAKLVKDSLAEISQCTDVINNYNMNVSLSREINDAVVQIRSAIVSLDEN